MDYDRLFSIAESARARQRLSGADTAFVRDAIPAALGSYPNTTLPRSIRHPGGFAVAGAPVGTFVRGALLLAGQKAFGARYDGAAFYERVETDLAMRIMRSHFHHGFPKGTHCCPQCTLAILPVLEAGAIRYFDGKSLARDVRGLIAARAWRFSRAPNAKMLSWALDGPQL